MTPVESGASAGMKRLVLALFACLFGLSYASTIATPKSVGSKAASNFKKHQVSKPSSVPNVPVKIEKAAALTTLEPRDELSSTPFTETSIKYSLIRLFFVVCVIVSSALAVHQVSLFAQDRNVRHLITSGTFGMAAFYAYLSLRIPPQALKSTDYAVNIFVGVLAAFLYYVVPLVIPQDAKIPIDQTMTLVAFFLPSSFKVVRSLREVNDIEANDSEERAKKGKNGRKERAKKSMNNLKVAFALAQGVFYLLSAAATAHMCYLLPHKVSLFAPFILAFIAQVVATMAVALGSKKQTLSITAIIFSVVANWNLGYMIKAYKLSRGPHEIALLVAAIAASVFDLYTIHHNAMTDDNPEIVIIGPSTKSDEADSADEADDADEIDGVSEDEDNITDAGDASGAANVNDATDSKF